MLFDVATSIITATLGALAVYTTIIRWRVTRLDIMLWLALSLALLTVLYLIFTYNAVLSQTNQPWRYYLRFVHMGHFIILILLQRLKTRLDGLAIQQAQQIVEGGRRGAE